jgi:hypothetical protein
VIPGDPGGIRSLALSLRADAAKIADVRADIDGATSAMVFRAKAGSVARSCSPQFTATATLATGYGGESNAAVGDCRAQIIDEAAQVAEVPGRGAPRMRRRRAAGPSGERLRRGRRPRTPWSGSTKRTP